MSRERVAVIGAGVSGLTAGYLLQRRYDVTLFEASPRLGGHAHTHDVTAPDGAPVAVDSGFIVHNERTYPNLLRLFGELDVRTQDCEMSMSVRCLGCGLEYAGRQAGFRAAPTSGTSAQDTLPADARRDHPVPSARPPSTRRPGRRSGHARRVPCRWPVFALSRSRWCRRCSRRANGSAATIRPGTCSSSCATTGCCR